MMVILVEEMQRTLGFGKTRERDYFVRYSGLRFTCANFNAAPVPRLPPQINKSYAYFDKKNTEKRGSHFIIL